jgi:NADH:ubiquinone oxidoreductase subunit 6 (subunit J)
MAVTGTHIIAAVSASAFAGAVAVTMVVVIMVMDITAAVLTTAVMEASVMAHALGPSWAPAAASTLSGVAGDQLPL